MCDTQDFICPITLNEFAFLHDWFEKLNQLETIAIKEDWKFKNSQPEKRNQQNPILENYIFHTFARLANERNDTDFLKENDLKVVITENKACFNTGLFTKNYQPIFGYFEKNNNPIKQPWILKGFFDEYSSYLADLHPLPIRAAYFNNISDLIYDTKLDMRINISHILDNPENRRRIPEHLRESYYIKTLFIGAIEMAKRKIEANYKVAVPQYYQGKIQLLIPVCLENEEKVDLALALTKRSEGYYTGSTCLTVDMAYNNARLIAMPNSDWLKP